ncbi:eukaryotic translation initiation factor 2-alpha kinase [Episyrphus balteatus]|uniref:eukaryotic translation initiation factor 2-alpha kinase n=1 Tax=Episyrphus balteatus TaxID=286459 RepID=UPI002486C538|nr:eukaryotic translation initiation factor 2-alpha kinase [Episyrphus balteatus]
METSKLLYYLDVIRNSQKSLLYLTMLTSIVAASVATSSTPLGQEGSSSIEQLPFCGEKLDRTIGRRLLYITTLDGTLSALDITKGGKVRWSVPTGPGPLISSSIHRLELTNNGQFVRMIPSLSGGIYKFDGDSIDPIPITTENLLSSSFKFSDDLVISGGKETRSYGVSARTGQLLYECSMNGCVNSTDSDTMQNSRGEDAIKTPNPDTDQIQEHDSLLDDVIVVRRQTQTVRAVESRTGVERWNFSVGQHELDLMKSAECHDRQFSELDMAVLDLEVKVIVPEGIVCAFSKSNPGHLLWKHKFEHPIVSGWQIGSDDMLQSIDFFGTAQWLWNSDGSEFDPPASLNPSIYLGMYQKQLYIQESFNLRKEITDKTHLFNHLMNNESKLPKIPWKPIAASSNSLVIFNENSAIAPIENGSDDEEDLSTTGKELVPFDVDNTAVSAQSVLYASEYVNGNGFYLYAEDRSSNQTNNSICNTDSATTPIPGSTSNTTLSKTANNNASVVDEFGFSFDDVDAPVKVVIISLWFWWKEIAMIVFTTAVLVNFLLGPRNRPEREIVVIERHIPVPTATEAIEMPITRSATNFSGQRSFSESTTHSGDNFLSRFQADFDLERCLGRGGFGVVFEAKNKLDDCKYAIKRITLPNKKDSRERVMREVKTLANCEHHNIVRYFQAWVETPPPGWQEEEDSRWIAKGMSHSIEIETPDGTTLPPFDGQSNNNFAKDKKKLLESWISSVNTKCSATTNGRGEDDSSFFDDECGIIDEEDEDEGDDSCIVFRTESQSMAMRDEEQQACGNSIAIDIHSNESLFQKANGRVRDLDCSNLSDSFQIEFVHSANGGANGDEEEAAENVPEEENSLRKRKSSLSLDFNGRSKALVAAKNVPYSGPKIQTKVFLYIQMQLCRKDSLRDWLRENTAEARAMQIRPIFEQIVDAVDYVHLKGLIHRDLKPSNIFFSQDGQIKIGDFGLVTDMSEIPNLVTPCGDGTGLPQCPKHTQQVGTHLYMSPEQLKGQHYDYKVDIYSLGLIFFELLVYFSTEMERIVTLRDLRDGKFPPSFSNKFPIEYELLKLMLSAVPAKRPPTDQLKSQLNQMIWQEKSSDATTPAAVVLGQKKLIE